MPKMPISSKNWEKIRSLYLKGMKPREIVEKFKDLDITAKQISNRFSTENITGKKRKIEEKVQEKQEERIIKEKDRVNKRHEYLYDMGLDVVEEILEVYKKTAQERKKIGNVNPFNLEKIFSCIEKAQKGQRLALNIDLEDTEEKEPEVFVIKGLDLEKI